MSTLANTPRSLSDWQAMAAGLHIETGLFIDGHYQSAKRQGSFANVNPATGQTLAIMALGEACDVDAAVANAQVAWRDGRWHKLAPRQRMDVMFNWANLVEQHGDELALLECLDMGKPITDVLNIDLPEVLRTIRFFAECIDKLEGAVTHTAANTLHTIVHEPLGVVGAITPWNYPLLMAVWKLAPILAAGNCVVLKPAEQAPLSCTRLAQLFVQAGGPAGVFNVVNGTGQEAGRALALHHDVAKITFTGSTAVGKLLMGYSGQSNMKRVALETGGKSPQIFMPDLYDLDAAVDRAVGGIFDNAGQVCNAGSRLLVHRSLHDQFVDRFVARTRELYQPGDPLDPATTMGPLASHAHLSNVQRRMDQAQADGATQVLPSPEFTGPGAFCPPALFVGAHNRMAIVQEEVFGPVATVQAFDTEQEALMLANDCQFGLAASVWTSDLNTAHRMVSALEAGVTWVNCFGDGDMSQPFGGYKLSGNSRDKNQASLTSYMQIKSSWFNLQR
jgi:acyl-CoA reductase-like NAD-dependent aldehyde dehydrogenase